MGGGTTTIEFLNKKTEAADILEELIAEYEESHPGVTIEMTTSADADTILSTRMASDDTPDIFTASPNSELFSKVDSGYVMDLSDTGIMDHIQQGAREQWKYNGGEYAATISYNCSGIWYNKDIFEKLEMEVPETWEELMELCQKLESSGYTPFVSAGKEVSITDRYLQVFLASTMGDAYADFQQDSKAGTIDAEKGYGESLKKMAEKMLQMVSYSQEDILGTDQDSATANFANGEGAMMIGGSWLLASIRSANPEMNVAMMPIPGDTAEETNTCAFPGDLSLSIAQDTEAKEEAIEFVKWMTSAETATKYAKQEGNPSCISGVDYVAEEFKELYETYVTTNKFILNPDCDWTNAQADAVGAAVQQLYYDSDAEAFPENLEAAVNDNK